MSRFPSFVLRFLQLRFKPEALDLCYFQGGKKNTNWSTHADEKLFSFSRHLERVLALCKLQEGALEILQDLLDFSHEPLQQSQRTTQFLRKILP